MHKLSYQDKLPTMKLALMTWYLCLNDDRDVQQRHCPHGSNLFYFPLDSGAPLYVPLKDQSPDQQTVWEIIL